MRTEMPVHPGCVKRHPDMPKSVPMALLRPYEKQAQTNHAQSLERLAKRGGLDWIEMDWIIRGVRWGTEDQHTVAHERRAGERVLAKLAELQVVTPPTPEQEAYLKKIEQDGAGFDPTKVVGGPR